MPRSPGRPVPPGLLAVRPLVPRRGRRRGPPGRRPGRTSWCCLSLSIRPRTSGDSPPGPGPAALSRLTSRAVEARSKSAWICLAVPASTAPRAASACATSSSLRENHWSLNLSAGNAIIRRRSASASSRRWLSARSRFTSSVSSANTQQLCDRSEAARPSRNGSHPNGCSAAGPGNCPASRYHQER